VPLGLPYVSVTVPLFSARGPDVSALGPDVSAYVELVTASVPLGNRLANGTIWLIFLKFLFVTSLEDLFCSATKPCFGLMAFLGEMAGRAHFRGLVAMASL
jgi:hypothetical protein